MLFEHPAMVSSTTMLTNSVSPQLLTVIRYSAEPPDATFSAASSVCASSHSLLLPAARDSFLIARHGLTTLIAADSVSVNDAFAGSSVATRVTEIVWMRSSAVPMPRAWTLGTVHSNSSEPSGSIRLGVVTSHPIAGVAELSVVALAVTSV